MVRSRWSLIHHRRRRWFHLADQARHRFAIPAAAVVPALASTFDSWVTSVECVTTRPSWYVRAFRPVILSSHACMADFPLRKQKLGVSLQDGFSQFGTVSQESYWQALPYLFGWALRR